MNPDFPTDLHSNLQELQAYYQGLVEHASSQLAHVNALLELPTVLPVPETQAPPVVKEVPTPKKRVKPAIFNTSVPSSPPPVVKTPRGKAKKVAATAKSKPSDILALNPQYQGQTLLEAIAQVLKNLEGQKVNADTVVKELHGELSPELYRTAKDRVTKNLSKGKIESKWNSVPGQTGLYTFSLSKV
jgi:hypothetical protein